MWRPSVSSFRAACASLLLRKRVPVLWQEKFTEAPRTRIRNGLDSRSDLLIRDESFAKRLVFTHLAILSTYRGVWLPSPRKREKIRMNTKIHRQVSIKTKGVLHVVDCFAHTLVVFSIRQVVESNVWSAHKASSSAEQVWLAFGIFRRCNLLETDTALPTLERFFGPIQQSRVNYVDLRQCSTFLRECRYKGIRLILQITDPHSHYWWGSNSYVDRHRESWFCFIETERLPCFTSCLHLVSWRSITPRAELAYIATQRGATPLLQLDSPAHLTTSRAAPCTMQTWSCRSRWLLLRKTVCKTWFSWIIPPSWFVRLCTLKLYHCTHLGKPVCFRGFGNFYWDILLR